MVLVDPLHRKHMARGVADIVQLPGHSNHVSKRTPRLPFQPSRLRRTSAGLAEEGAINDSVDADHAFAGVNKVLNRLFRYLRPTRSVVVIYQNIIVGQRRSRDAGDLFFELYVEAACIREYTLQKGRRALPGVRPIRVPRKHQNANFVRGSLGGGSQSTHGAES